MDLKAKIVACLIKNNYVYTEDIKFPACKNKIGLLPFSFLVMIPVTKQCPKTALIMVDGKDVFESSGDDLEFCKRQENAVIRSTYAKEQNMPLLRISYKETEVVEDLIKTFVGEVSTGKMCTMVSNVELYKPYLLQPNKEDKKMDEKKVEKKEDEKKEDKKGDKKDEKKIEDKKGDEKDKKVVEETPTASLPTISPATSATPPATALIVTDGKAMTASTMALDKKTAVAAGGYCLIL
jgi:hypothetical protein